MTQNSYKHKPTALFGHSCILFFKKMTFSELKHTVQIHRHIQNDRQQNKGEQKVTHYIDTYISEAVSFFVQMTFY